MDSNYPMSNDPNDNTNEHTMHFTNQSQYGPLPLPENHDQQFQLGLEQLASAGPLLYAPHFPVGLSPTLSTSPGRNSATGSSTVASPNFLNTPSTYGRHPSPPAAPQPSLFLNSGAPAGQQLPQAQKHFTEHNQPPYSFLEAFGPQLLPVNPVQQMGVPNDRAAASPSRPLSMSSPVMDPLSPEEITLETLLARCNSQDANEAWEHWNLWNHDAERQSLLLRLMWNWYLKREVPSNDELLQFHAAERPSPADHRVKGPGSRGGAKGYSCLWPGCAKPTNASRSDRAHEHTLLHLRVKPFRCSACGSEFTRNNELRRHEKTCKHKKAQESTTAESSTQNVVGRNAIASTSRRNSARFSPVAQRPAKKPRATRGVSSEASNSEADSPISPIGHRHSTGFARAVVSQQLAHAQAQPLYIVDPVPSTSTTHNVYTGEQYQSPFSAGYTYNPSASSSAAPAPMFIPPAPTSPSSSPHSVYASIPPFPHYGPQRPFEPHGQFPFSSDPPNDSFVEENLGPRQFQGM